MKYARIYKLNSEVLKRDAAGFVRLRDEDPKAAFKLACIECGERVFLNDEKGARGIRVVNLEVTRRGQKNKLPGFSHYKGNADKDCPLYFSADPRFQRFHESNEFDALDKERNLEVLNRPNMRKAIAEAQRFFMQRLTGEPVISAEDRENLDLVEKKLLSMRGIAEYPWTMAYMGPLLVGSRNRQLGHRVCRVEYMGRGEQRLPFTGSDGEQRILCVPKMMQLCFSRRAGLLPKPLRRDGRNPIEFDVSRSFAHSLVSDAWHGESAPRVLAAAAGASASRSQQIRLNFGD